MCCNISNTFFHLAKCFSEWKSLGHTALRSWNRNFYCCRQLQIIKLLFRIGSFWTLNLQWFFSLSNWFNCLRQLFPTSVPGTTSTPWAFIKCSSPKKSYLIFKFEFFIICIPPEFIPVLGPLTLWCASTLGAALLCSSRADSDSGLISRLEVRVLSVGFVFPKGLFSTILT